MSKSELEALTRRFTYEISILIGPDKDIPAPDVYTNPQTMAWMMDTYSMIKGYPIPGVVTGKPVCIGGSRGRMTATGRGVMYTTLDVLKHLKINPKQAKIAIQGFGNVGFYAAKTLHEQGCNIVALSDSRGGIYSKKNLDPSQVMEHKKASGSVINYKESENISNEELLGLDCDVLIPAALENTITSKNASNVKAKILVEGANGPTTPEADEILNRNDVFLVPDILANAGGVVVSYFEWVQDLQSFFWSEKEVNGKLESIMLNSFADVLGAAKKYEVDMRTAAYILAIQKEAEVIQTRMVWP
jgi:glutamate dehydrogenase (NAD(P)+)